MASNATESSPGRRSAPQIDVDDVDGFTRKSDDRVYLILPFEDGTVERIVLRRGDVSRLIEELSALSADADGGTEQEDTVAGTLDSHWVTTTDTSQV